MPGPTLFSALRSTLAWLAPAGLFLPRPALAHVKWFSDYDVAETPEPLRLVLDSAFATTLVGVILLIILVTVCDRVLAGHARQGTGRRLAEALDAAVAGLGVHGPDVLRVGLGVFMTCLWLLGGTILTPELKTDQAWISWFQLAIAACTLSWRTTPLAVLGVVVLYGIAIARYGLFHMMDYPLFLGIGAYLLIHAMGWRRLLPYALSILYGAMAATLFWASIEKWAYWDWTMPVLTARPYITLGIDHRYYIILAGFVEFALTYMILVGRTSQRMTALALLLIFIMAIVDFGKIDAVGHSMIILTLAVIILEGNTAINRVFQKEHIPMMAEGIYHAAVFLGLLVLYFGLYYGLHRVIYG